jgi:hypothetical protein
VKIPETLVLRNTVFMAAAFIFLSISCRAQESAPAAPQALETSLHHLDSEVHELRATIEQMRSENAESRTEVHELRMQLEEMRRLLSPIAAAMNQNPSSPPEPSTAAAASTVPSKTSVASEAPTTTELNSRLQRLEESTQLLGAKIDEQQQTKVETASKYRARLSGIVLMNAFHNVGASDNLDIPDYAQPVAPGSPEASFGATLRQSEIGLEVFGPNLFGAKSAANVQLDFAGGFPSTPNGVDFGIARLQTASLRLDWSQTSVIAGQDSLFISPLSPTSFASLAIPTFAYAGNLWAWTPQLRVEHRFALSDQQSITLQGGILDNLDWEFPYDPFYRSATAGEQSGQPAYAFRTAWSRPVFEHPLSFAVAGYYGRQNWSWDRFVDAWAGMTDWQIPIFRRLNLSGEFYRGRGVGGLGGGIGRSILYGGNPNSPATSIHGLDAAGGWSQFKLQITPKLELNGVLAQDDAFASDVRGFATDFNNSVPILGRNRGALTNVVYRPRSDLLLSAEFRRLHTFPVYSEASITNQINLAMGILF